MRATANAADAIPTCATCEVRTAAPANNASAAPASGNRRRCANHAATTNATSGGNASAASSRCAPIGPVAPLTTASRVAPAADSAVSRSHGPGDVPLRSLDDVEKDERGNLDSGKNEQDESDAVDGSRPHLGRPVARTRHVAENRPQPVARAEEHEGEEA